jgi:uncharacterized protein YraI/heat shock protein HslJ
MRKIIHKRYFNALTGIMFISGLLLTACASATVTPPAVNPPSTTTPALGQAPAATETLPATATQGPTDTSGQPAATATLALVPAEAFAASGLGDVIWEWNGSTDNSGRVISVADPSRYALQFFPEGQIAIWADCNHANGVYRLDGASLTIEIGSITKMACKPDSQAVEFLKELGEISGQLQKDGWLYLEWKMDSGAMKFAPQTILSIPAPVAGSVVGTASANTRVYTGPGKEYLSFGIFAAGGKAEVIGRTKHNTWWVIKMPGYPDGIGWVSSQLVRAEGGETVKVQPLPETEIVGTFPFPPVDDPQVIVTELVMIRAGPSESYPVVLAGLAGQSFSMLGKSTDGQYWLVYLPPAQVPTGLGWIPTAAVHVSNAELSPVVKAPPMPVVGRRIQPVPGKPAAAALITLNIRSGPGEDYAVLDYALPGEVFPITGQTVDGMWYQIQVSPSMASGGKGWLMEPNVQVFNPESSIAVVSTPLPAYLPTEAVGQPCSLAYQSPVNGKLFRPNVDFSEEVEILNNTRTTWSRGNVDLAFVTATGGQALHTGPDAYDLSASIIPGQTARFTIPAASPFVAGEFTEIWSLKNGSTTICTFTFGIVLNATPVPPTATYAPTQTGTIEPTNRPDVPPTATVGTPEPTNPPEVTPTPKW